MIHDILWYRPAAERHNASSGGGAQWGLEVGPVTKPAPKPDIVQSEEVIGDELFLYDNATGAVHTLNSGAAMVWLLCDGQRDEVEISQEIAAANDLPAEQVLPQVREAVAQFRTLGLLEG
jgi:PqqD family protein of HPr-rel-A system